MFHRRLRRLLALLLLLCLCLAAWLLQRQRRAAALSHVAETGNLISPQLLAQFTAIEQRERLLDDTTWAPERRAEQCAASFEALWNRLNQATNKAEVLASFAVGELLVGQYGACSNLCQGIEVRRAQPPYVTWSQPEWRDFLNAAQAAGWRLGHIEFRLRAFAPADESEPERGRFSFRADVERTNGLERATLEGDLAVRWATNAATGDTLVSQIDARQVTVRSRRGEPPFKTLLSETIAPPEKWLLIDPLILYDLDGDGLSEIILAGKNRVYHRQPDGRYQSAPLCKDSPGRIFTALIADFDGDGFADFLCAKPEGLWLFHGSAHGTFDEPGRLVWKADPPLNYGQVLTCADIARDGDLDVFLAQYKSPYFHGQMPTPYFDANDGDPAYLLLNDGRGNFSDATENCGLAAKRHRRTYSASFVRLPGDEAMDLAVISDFAGVDLYRNDGRGHFRDVTATRLADPIGFGMAHTLADFNQDGRLDLLMIGMRSPAVDRLNSLKLSRPEAYERRDLMTRLASGNKLWLAREDGGFEDSAPTAGITRSGWSWGCSAFDFDNNGFPDVYIANGQDSRASVHDYDPEFWLHDIYVGDSRNDRAADLYFRSKFTRTRGQGDSYGGYEQNRLFLNVNGAFFVEVGHLMGAGLEQDCRNAVADDLDGDGKMDLLVTTFEVWPVPKQTLRVYRNSLPGTGNWIGFRFREEGRGKSPAGTSVTVHYGQHLATAQLVTGDSYRCQSANTLHFGLGDATKVDWAEVIWPDGSRQRLETPEVNHYALLRRR
jgi:hypothetical protein